MRDRYDRKINYIRLSITDRCNLRCRYCMPNGLSDWVPMRDILSYEELLDVARAAAALEITRFKVTGGEPLIRRDCPEFIGELKKIPGVEQVTMTSNGVLLARLLPRLLENGLDAVNVSLDTLKRERFSEITGMDELPAVLSGIDEAVRAGLKLKLNAVLQPGVNEEERWDLLSLAKDRPLDIRFIELMPIGHGKDSRPVYNEILRSELKERFPGLERDESVHGNGPAEYWRIPGYRGSVGFISAMHGKFCGSCNRIRLTSTGKLKPCLCYGNAVDLMPVLRGERYLGREREGERIAALRKRIRQAISEKPESHCFEKLSEISEEKIMAAIGG